MLLHQARPEQHEHSDASDLNEHSSEAVGAVKESTFVSLKSRLPQFEGAQIGVVTSFPTRAVADRSSDALTSISKNDPQKAFRLPEDVKVLIPKILAEKELLKLNLVELKSQAEAQIEATEERSQASEAANGALRSKIETLEAMVLDLRAKLQKSEGLIAVEKELSSKVSQEAAEAECLAKLFEDTVISSFGVGTMFQDALTRIQLTAK